MPRILEEGWEAEIRVSQCGFYVSEHVLFDTVMYDTRHYKFMHLCLLNIAAQKVNFNEWKNFKNHLKNHIPRKELSEGQKIEE